VKAILERRAFHGQPIGEPGTYVDVGAFMPIQYSNTYALYARGWKGLTIEATPGSAEVFRAVRPRDTHINCAVGPTVGTLPFYTWGAPSVINTADPVMAKQFEELEGRPPVLIDVPMRPLRDILSEHLAGQRVDVMSIDIEGMTMVCLESNDWTKWKPTILLIEVDQIPVLGQPLDPAIAFVMDLGYVVSAITGPTVILELLPE
jgi:FkbM family methyltransferase